MSQEIQVGDVVRINKRNCAGWDKVLGTHPYVVVDVRPSVTGINRCCYLETLDGKPITKDMYSAEATWSCYLTKDEFLSAVHQRKGKRKHAATT